MNTPKRRKTKPAPARSPLVQMGGGRIDGDLKVVGRAKTVKIYGTLPPQVDPAQALRRYREWVVRQCAQIDLGDLSSASDAGHSGGRVSLARVYIDLDTTSEAKSKKGRGRQTPDGNHVSDAEGTRRLTAIDAILKHPRVALLGLPGAGKSTFIRHVSLHLGAAPLPPTQGVLKELDLALGGMPKWPAKEAGLVPITVVLRRFAAAFAPKAVSDTNPNTASHAKPARACHLWEFIQNSLREENLADATHPLREALEEGRALVFFDGLDEVPDDGQKQFVCQAVKEFAQSAFAPCRMVLTCRTFSYRNQDWVVPGFEEFELAELDDAKIQEFITAWFQALAEEGVMTAEQARHKSSTLWSGISGRGLRELAGNPLQLTNMAVLHRVETLPDNRALLYDRLVRLLLLQWDKVRFDRDRLSVPLHALRDEADCRENEFVDGLARLAWEVHDPKHAGKPGQAADISELELRGALEHLHPSQDESPAGLARKAAWALRVVKVFRQRGGLLREEGRGVFKFPHRSYQEFLAGTHLAQQPEFASRAGRLVDDSRHWWEVVRWAANYMAYVKRSIDGTLALAADLCADVEQHDTSPLAWRKVYLAGDILAEIGVNQVRRCRGLGETCLAQSCRLLIQLVNHAPEILPATERAAAGVALGRLGDERPGVGLKDGLPDLDFGTELLSPGTLRLGETGKEVLVPRWYRISRYPVTVAQFRAFVEAGGYADKAQSWWTKDGWDWMQRRKVIGPEDYDPVFQTTNHPRVGLSWFEAMAFCEWLTQQLHARGRLAENEKIALPTEAQWELAARWNKKTGAPDDRLYPWGGKDESELPQHCNMAKTGIGHTSAVGLFPSGRADCGAMDMSGNVWEWCENLYRPDQTWRVLRGGCWRDDDPELLRCSFRNCRPPDLRYSLIGFRCVWVMGASARG